MQIRTRLNVAAQIEHVAEAQYGYFTRAQAYEAGIKDFELARATSYEQIARVGHGVYRIVGAPSDRLEDLRVAWLRLDPRSSPRKRTSKPDIWVSHRSAARVLGLGVFLADVPEFISTRKLQPRFEAHIRVRGQGIPQNEWVVRRGFCVTSVARTMADLVRASLDHGHLGQFASDALRTGAATEVELQGALGEIATLNSILAMAEK